MNLSSRTFIQDYRSFIVMAVHDYTIEVIEDANNERGLRTLNRWLFEEGIESGELKEVDNEANLCL